MKIKQAIQKAEAIGEWGSKVWSLSNGRRTEKVVIDGEDVFIGR